MKTIKPIEIQWHKVKPDAFWKEDILELIDEWIILHPKLLMRNDFGELIEELKAKIKG